MRKKKKKTAQDCFDNMLGIAGNRILREQKMANTNPLTAGEMTYWLYQLDQKLNRALYALHQTGYNFLEHHKTIDEWLEDIHHMTKEKSDASG